jgi:hypothetical protein
MSRAGERLRAWMAMLGGRREQTGAPGGDGDREERAVNAILPDDDEPGWRGVQRPWHIVRGLLLQAASACETNPLAARLISMTTDFVIGSGATLRVRPAPGSVARGVPSDAGDPNAWVQAFWNHPLNHLSDRIYAWCDELSRSGELFLVLSRNPADGMSYVREIPALQIDAVETDPEDRERELRYHQLTEDVEGRYWSAESTPLPVDKAAAPEGFRDDPDQVMLHYAINRPVGAIRGRSDLAQILPWLERYDLWLEDRVRINRYKGAYLWHVRIDNAASGQLEAKRRQYSRVPRPGSIIISDASEHWEAVSPQINADDVAADGKAIRLMIAAGAGVPLHYLAEGDSATRATAREMGTPTLRRFAHRQFLFESILTDLIRTAARRGGLGEISVKLRFESVLSEADREETVTLPERALPQNPLPVMKGD